MIVQVSAEDYHGRRLMGEGVCIGCGEWQQVEEGARKQPCETCDEPKLFDADIARALGRLQVHE